MERGSATRGRVALAISGADDIEIKATVPHHQIKQALKRFALTENNDEERYIYFFDTPKLDLLGAGIITRARRVVGDAHDCTVKFRPVNPADVGQKWRRYRDFKIEADASETRIACQDPASAGSLARTDPNQTNEFTPAVHSATLIPPSTTNIWPVM